MKSYKKSNNILKIETNNCVINITENLTDRLGRNVTSVSISPDRFIGEPENRLYGYYNTRVVTLKKRYI